MQTSRFQLGLIATLAVGLGFSLASSEAVGYPAGTSVSLGSNPISSRGGDATSEPELLFDAAESGPFIITDVVLTQDNCGDQTRNASLVLANAEGTKLARYRLSSDQDGTGYSGRNGSTGAVVSHSYSSGIAVPAGTGIYAYSDGYCTVSYSISGYQAQG